jgi:hypothetical protein
MELSKQQPSTNKVYVLDLAGDGEWRRFAPMISAKANFACAVRDGKKVVVPVGKGSGFEYQRCMIPA